jgi:glycosyltransferase involved in cell wall biosynthesis
MVVTSGARGLPSREVRDGVEIRRVPVFGRGDRSVASLRSMLTYPPGAWLAATGLDVDNFDVINAHFAVPTGPGSLPIARLHGVPHVLSIHGGDIFDPSKRLSPHRWSVLRGVVALVMEASAAVVAQSENTRTNAYRFYDYRGPIDVIPLGLRFPEPPDVTREALDLPDDAFVLVTVGRLIERKGLDRLLRAVAGLRPRRFHLVVVGSGPQLEALRGLAAELGIADSVAFTGWVSEEQKWRLLRASDAYVSTSLHEGFGLVFIEGMAMGLPVVAPDHGGQVDFLVDGVTGYVTPAGVDEATTAAIAALMDAPESVARMRAENRIRAGEYGAGRCADRYEELFERVSRATR